MSLSVTQSEAYKNASELERATVDAVLSIQFSLDSLERSRAYQRQSEDAQISFRSGVILGIAIGVGTIAIIAVVRSGGAEEE